MKLHSRFSALAVPSLLVLVGCSSMISSLAPRLHDNAVAYDAAISDINDHVLLANIVRSRDYVPLSMTELSTITGTLSEQASLGLSVPFGGNYGSTPRGTGTPSVQLGTAPTFSMAALNTRGFTLNIIQPISPVYVASKWSSGISHELLLLLFVKNIQFADSYARSADECAHKPVGPVNPADMPAGSARCARKKIYFHSIVGPLRPCWNTVCARLGAAIRLPRGLWIWRTWHAKRTTPRWPQAKR